MSLATGVKVGSYQIIAPLGAGGMGEVYRARDTKLKRDVALKVLPEAFALDPERMARFQREAEVLASLNHPNIAHIYGVEENALVMELVEGENLKGPLPIDTALNYAKQIAEALEAAHEKGIVHRDLKPANVMITAGGVVKVLDFGLAAVLQGPTRTSDPAASPTLTMRSTEAGMIMGTAAYMSPEQASGKPVDKRADIWSFGVVLWEMLTGHRLFDGETISHTLADVLRGEIDFGKLPAETPTSIRELLRRCLDRNVKNRLRDIGEARVVIERGGVEVVPTAVRRKSIVPWAVAALTTLSALALGIVAYHHAKEETRVLKFSVPLPEGATARPTLPAVSPDGRRVAFGVFTGQQRMLAVRELDSLGTRILPGTEDIRNPFWSPDSRFVAFFAGGKLKKIEVSGGAAVTLCNAAEIWGGSWGNNDVIVFAPASNSGLSRVSATGGTPTAATQLDRYFHVAHRYPWFLPDGRHFLYTAESVEAEKTAAYVADLDSQTQREVLAADSNVVYAPPGYLLFLRERTLMAQAFDVSAAKPRGDPIRVAEDVEYLSTLRLGLFSSSQNGVLAYSSGAVGGWQHAWVDRSGKVTGTMGAPGVSDWPAISPDGATVAVERQDPQTGVFDIWLHDLNRGSASRFTFGPQGNRYPVWSPDGSHIAFQSMRDTRSIYQKATNGAAELVPLDTDRFNKRAEDWSGDGRYIIERRPNKSNSGFDIWVLPTSGDRKAAPYLQTEFNEQSAKLSPNGQWLAYASDESKRYEIYVQTFPTAGGKWQVSTNGGNLPVWSRDGKELFYIAADQKMMAVQVKSGSRFEAGVPKPLFATILGSLGLRFDVSKDGRFLLPTVANQTDAHSINVVVNWTAGLKK